MPLRRSGAELGQVVVQRRSHDLQKPARGGAIVHLELDDSALAVWPNRFTNLAANIQYAAKTRMDRLGTMGESSDLDYTGRIELDLGHRAPVPGHD